MSERKGFISIFYTINDRKESLDIERYKLYRYPFFRKTLTAHPNLTGFCIFPNNFIKEIVELLYELQDPINNYIATNNIEKDIRFCQALLFLGKKTPEIINMIKEKLLLIQNDHIVVKHIEDFQKAHMLKEFADLYQTWLTEDCAFPLNDEFIHIMKKDFTLEEKSLISKIMPYMTSFAHCFVICEIYELDFDLIEAKPSLRDMFIYRRTKYNIPSETVCKIYAFSKLILDNFLRYFDVIKLSYKYNIDEKDGYINFKHNMNFYLEIDGSIPWYSRNTVRIEGQGFEKISSMLDNSVIFKTLGNFPVNTLSTPVTDDFYDNENFFLVFKIK